MTVVRCAIGLAAIFVAGGWPMSTAVAGQTGAHGFSGLCAYYAESGKVASGARFDPNGFTAAHRTLPFGTRVRVIDDKSGRSVIVTITDRGPFGGGRVIDVSPGAARALDMIDRGVIYVRAEVL